MPYAAIIAAVASLIGQLISSGKEAEAQALRQKMADQLGPDILPHLDKAVAEHVDSSMPTGAADVGRTSQLETLKQLENEYQTGGMSKADQGAYDVAARQVNQRASSDAGNISAQLAQRGQSGTGLGAVLASQSGQDSLEALAGLDAEAASAGRSRAMQALMGKASTSGALRSGDYEKSGAIDTMNRFNAAGLTAAQMYNLGIPQQNFDNNLSRINGQNTALAGVASGIDSQGRSARETAAGVGNAALSYGAAADWAQDPENPKNKKKGG